MGGAGLIPHIYSTDRDDHQAGADDYKAAAANVREVGEIAGQFKLTAMFEFVRTVHASRRR